MKHTTDHDYMHRALELAQIAAEKGEVPIGAVVVYQGEIVGEGYNQPIQENDPTAHAEVIALRAAAKKIGNYRLLGCTLYVTLEPCPMCAGAMIHARIHRLVYAASDLRKGAANSVFQLTHHPALNHQIICEHGILEEEASALLKSFFVSRRG